MRKRQSVTSFLLGTKLFLVTCFLLTNAFVVCEVKSSNNNNEEEILKKWDLADWGNVSLSESWEKKSSKGDTTLFVLYDNSASLKFYKVKGAKSAGDMKSYLQKKARKMEIPTFYRTVSPDHLENVNADNGGFVQGTHLLSDKKTETVVVDSVQIDTAGFETVQADTSSVDSAQISESVADGLGNEDEKTEKIVQYIVVAGLQNSKGVFIFEAKSTNLEEVPMSISRTQRNWMLR